MSAGKYCKSPPPVYGMAMKRTGPIPVEGDIAAFPRGGRTPAGSLGGLIDEYGHGSARHLPLHRNPGLEIVYLRHGRLIWQYEGRQETLAPGSVFFTLPWEAHGSTSEFEPGHEWYFVVLRTSGKPLQHSTPLGFPSGLGLPDTIARRLSTLLGKAPHRAWPASPMLATLLPALVRELDETGPLHEAYASRLAALLIIELGRIVAAGMAAPDSDPVAGRLAAFLTDLERRCDEPWTLATMAAEVGLKRTQFASDFQHHTGDTPIRYLNRLRVERARKLLSGTRRPITDIAFDCGFSSCQYFASVFLEFTGLSASLYRQRHRRPHEAP